MIDLGPGDFREFFEQLHATENGFKGASPFPWQEALADQVCSGKWPEVIDLPTASGKTACIDIALFALALNSNAPRRIFFVVDRRVVVDEAFARMNRIKTRLANAKTGMLRVVADCLQALSGDPGGRATPVDAYQLRGGAYRDESWVKSPQQPTLVASTVDQVGSRLLFRGYGIRDKSWPIHAGLIANDSLIFLDEAHCSRAFAQTLQAIERYRSTDWAEEPLVKPFHYVEMTATPSRVEMTATPSRQDATRIFSLGMPDRENEILRKRLEARKPVQLLEIKGKKDDFAKLADELAAQAVLLAKTLEAKRVATMVNRVRTARLVYARLKKIVGQARVELVIGSMRPLDRDCLHASLEPIKSGNARKATDTPLFVVSTQCLEVGADFDFDALVSECASIDALQQRFGRLDRLGDFGRAAGSILNGSWQNDAKNPDAVYGESLSKTWQYLKDLEARNVGLNLGIEARAGEPPTVTQEVKGLDKEFAQQLKLTGNASPALLPSHLDSFAQTSPGPINRMQKVKTRQLESSPELFLHGPDNGVPDVQVVWRADLNAVPSNRWQEIVAVCPPVSTEAMPVAISAFRRWLAGSDRDDPFASDIESALITPEELNEETVPKRKVLAWRGRDNQIVLHPREVRPGDTLVLPVDCGGWETFGHMPENSQRDLADQAAFKMRRHVSLRLHTSVIAEWPLTAARADLESLTNSPSSEKPEILDSLRSYRATLDSSSKPWPYPLLAELDNLRGLRVTKYPADQNGFILDGWKQNPDGAKKSNDDAILLDSHSIRVAQAANQSATALLPVEFAPVFETAGTFHDYGKVDLRFQTWLRGGDELAAQLARRPIAKSGRIPVGDWKTCGLPANFDHEHLSLLFADKALPNETHGRDLILHLIASHHGECRPFAAVSLDPNADCVSYGGISLCTQERQDRAAHRLDTGVPDRFWRLTRRYGWWGLAYLEAIFRLADWAVSENEHAEVIE